MKATMGMGFHWQDNWYFKRIEDGSINIRHIVTKVSFPNKPHVDVDITIYADSWASIVASVSAQGETSETFKKAIEFHNQK